MPKIHTLPSRGTILRLVGTTAAVILMVYLLIQQDWREIGAALQQTSRLYLGLSLLAMVLSRLAISLRWHLLLRSGGARIRIGQSLQLTFAGLFASNFLPSTIGGDIVRLAGAFRWGIDSAMCLASLIVDRLVGIFSMSFALPLGLHAIRQLAMLSSPAVSWSLTLTHVKWVSAAWEKGLELLNRLLQALKRWLSQPVALTGSMLFSFAHMLCFFAAIWFLLIGMHDPLPFWLIAGLWSFIYLVTLLPFSINGLGVQEISMAFLFSRVGGISQQNGLILALLLRTLLMITSLPGAFFLPSILAEAKQHPEILTQSQN
jgi:uncharacterized membrane protein YbhN (UPF0104 family)